MPRPVALPALAAGLAIVLAALPAPAVAADDQVLDFAGDLYASGAEPDVGDAPRASVFAAGETVRSRASASGSVHLAGRHVEQSGPVGGSVYAAGQIVRVSAEVQGDANLAGQEVSTAAPVAGVIRAAAQRIDIDASAGALLLVGEIVRLDAPVAGDARIIAERLEIGPGARILGRLSVSAEEAPNLDGLAEGGVERIEGAAPVFGGGVGLIGLALGAAWSLIVGVLMVLLAQAIFFAVAPRLSDDLAFDVMERPFRSLGAGFLALAVLLGAIPLAAATIIGLPVAAIALAAAPLILWVGYALGAWALGAAIWRAANRPAPEGFAARLAIGLAGIAAAAVLSLAPIFGWMVSVALTLIGVGAAAGRAMAGRLA